VTKAHDTIRENSTHNY